MSKNSDTVNIRLRLSPKDVSDIEMVREFLGLKSTSSAAARLVVWNAKMLANALRSDGMEKEAAAESFSGTVSDVVADATRLAMRKFILSEVGK